MIESGWLLTGANTLASMFISATGIYIALLLFTRLSGLRSFSQMSSFDFAITVACGSILASTVLSEQPALMTGVGALAVLYLIQYVIARSRRLSRAVGRAVDNEPLVLMAGTEIIEAHMNRARITREDLYSKLRMAGVTHRDQVLAVTLETTGVFAVLKNGESLDPALFENIRGGQRVLALRR